MLYRILTVFLLSIGMLDAHAQDGSGIYLGNRQMIIFRAGVNKVWGSYVTAVVNQKSSKEKLSFGISLPVQTTDFQVQEGLDKSQVALDPNGGLNASAEFPPGTTVISVGFVADAQGDHATITIPVKEDADQLLVLLQDESLNLLSSQFQLGDDPQMAAVFGPGYRPFIFQGKAQKGSKVEFELTGIPQGRSDLYKLGGATGILLLGLGFWLARRTRPNSLEAAQ